jgi:hypothetical protein
MDQSKAPEGRSIISRMVLWASWMELPIAKYAASSTKPEGISFGIEGRSKRGAL